MVDGFVIIQDLIRGDGFSDSLVGGVGDVPAFAVQGDARAEVEVGVFPSLCEQLLIVIVIVGIGQGDFTQVDAVVDDTGRDADGEARPEPDGQMQGIVEEPGDLFKGDLPVVDEEPAEAMSDVFLEGRGDIGQAVQDVGIADAQGVLAVGLGGFLFQVGVDAEIIGHGRIGEPGPLVPVIDLEVDEIVDTGEGRVDGRSHLEILAEIKIVLCFRGRESEKQQGGQAEICKKRFRD